jgi:hypothetical protein
MTIRTKEGGHQSRAGTKVQCFITITSLFTNGGWATYPDVLQIVWKCDVVADCSCSIGISATTTASGNKLLLSTREKQVRVCKYINWC